MKTMLKIGFITLFIILLNGCAKKSPLANINEKNIKNNALIIGTLSREKSDKEYFRSLGFHIVTLENKLSKNPTLEGQVLSTP